MWWTHRCDETVWLPTVWSINFWVLLTNKKCSDLDDTLEKDVELTLVSCKFTSIIYQLSQ